MNDKQVSQDFDRPTNWAVKFVPAQTGHSQLFFVSSHLQVASFFLLSSPLTTHPLTHRPIILPAASILPSLLHNAIRNALNPCPTCALCRPSTMTSSNGITDPNVEDMSNAELFQYLFKAELDSNMPAVLPEALFHDMDVVASPSPSFSSSSSLSTPPASTSSPASSYDNSPVNSSLSYSSSSPPLSPYLQLDMEPHEHQQEPQQQEQDEQQAQLLQAQSFSPQLQSVPTYPTLLPSSSFSYRQLTPNMPPSMPVSSASLSTLHNADDQFLNLTHTATATASSVSNVSSDQMAFWIQRLQQIQQQQIQQQLLAPSLFSFSQSNSASSEPSDSPDLKSETHIIYPSPPMKDDMSIESDSDEGPSHGDSSSDPLKPSASELKKMTSKERRQLRNKLSARNFRVRRKGESLIYSEQCPS